MSQHLPRVLGPWTAAAVVVGTMIGSGVFKKARSVAENVPEFGLAMAAWVAGGVLALLGALAYAEVAARFPRAGGNYVFLREGYGRFAGFLWGWVEFTVIRSASIAVLAAMAVESFHDVLRQSNGGSEVFRFWPRQWATVGVIVGFTVLNARGTKLGGRVQLVLTILKAASLVGLVTLPVVIYLTAGPGEPRPTTAHLAPVWPADWTAVAWDRFGAALVGVLWAYHGWMNIGPIAEEVRDPQRNIPRSLCLGVLAVTVAYVTVNAAYYTAIPAAEMAALTNTPVATEFCFRLIGPVGALVASLVVMTSVLGSLNGNVLVAPRLLYAMAEDRLAPAALKKLHARYQTPVPAMVVYSGWACLLVLGLGALTRYRLPAVALGTWTVDPNLPAGKVPFDVLTDFAVFGAVVFETMAVAALFRFRALGAGLDPVYRCWGYPWVPLVYVVAMSAVAANMLATPAQRGEAVIGLGLMGLGAMVYGAFGRPKNG